MSSRYAFLKVLIAVALVGTTSLLGTAFAAKKTLTFEQAWAHCKAQLDNEKAYGTTLQGNERFIRGGACMKHFGYNL